VSSLPFGSSDSLLHPQPVSEESLKSVYPFPLCGTKLALELGPDNGVFTPAQHASKAPLVSDMTGRWRHFAFGCVTELALLVIAWIAALLLNWRLGTTIQWSLPGVFWGIAAVIPMFAAFKWSLRSPWAPAAEIRKFLEHLVRPIFGSWSIPQLALISALAGICEEALFRGVLQGWLASVAWPWVAIIVGGVAFGFAHPISRSYIVAATITGLYLGVLFWATGDLLAPILAHAVYDFCALVYFLRRYQSDPR
jgi:uncharacterized protein